MLLANELCAITNILQIVEQKPDCELFLYLDEVGLWIYSDKFDYYNSCEIYDALQNRIKFANNELLVKAIKTTNGDNNIIFDLTAGFGKDSILLAASGYNIVMLEQNPFLATIIGYFLYKFKDVYSWVNNMQIIYGNSINFLMNYQAKLPIAVYLDPMFQDKKSALAKKDMQIIKLLNDKFNSSCNENLDTNKLFDLGYKYAQCKLVVKRDNKQKPLVVSPPVSYAILGKTVRYDVYITSK